MELNAIIIDNMYGIPTTSLSIIDMFKYLISNKKYHQINVSDLIGKDEKKIHELFINKFGREPDNIIIWLTKVVDLTQFTMPPSIKINVLIDDIHQTGDNKIKIINDLAKCKKIFSTYAYLFKNFYNNTILNEIPVHFLPHSCRFMIEFNKNPVNKILLSGRLNKFIYPVRQMMYEKCKSCDYIEYLRPNVKYRIKKDHPKYIYGERYIKCLNNYIACFTCEAHIGRPYLLKKFFEIPGSGSLLLTINPVTKKYFTELGFIDNTHYISATTSNIEDKIKFILNPENRKTIDEIRMNGYELVKSKHMYYHRADLMDSIIRNNKLV